MTALELVQVAIGAFQGMGTSHLGFSVVLSAAWQLQLSLYLCFCLSACPFLLVCGECRTWEGVESSVTCECDRLECLCSLCCWRHGQPVCSCCQTAGSRLF